MFLNLYFICLLLLAVLGLLCCMGLSLFFGERRCFLVAVHRLLFNGGFSCCWAARLWGPWALLVAAAWAPISLAIGSRAQAPSVVMQIWIHSGSFWTRILNPVSLHACLGHFYRSTRNLPILFSLFYYGLSGILEWLPAFLWTLFICSIPIYPVFSSNLKLPVQPSPTPP